MLLGTIPPLNVTPRQEWPIDTVKRAGSGGYTQDLYKRLKLVASLLKDAGELPRRGRYLIWRDVHGAVQSRFIDQSMVIGRAPTCDIVLDNPRVSRRHCRIILDMSVTWIEDFDSTHGTKIGTNSKSRHLLKNGDVIEAGGTILAFITNFG